MTLGTLEAAFGWVKSLTGQRAGPLEVVFHGGEPLLAGESFYRLALHHLREIFGDQGLRLGIQSNLWLLSDELCELFAEYHVSLGTSLDGPEEINDAQRGQRCFRRTMAGIERARRHGLNVGCICTFTPPSASHYHEIFDFFAHERLDFSIHAAVPTLNSDSAALLHSSAPLTRAPEEPGISPNSWSLSPEAYGDLLGNLLDLYLANLNRVHISTLDALCRSISAGEGGFCTFRNCLGRFLAIAPDGAIYPCQRFVGHPEFRLGAVQNHPTWEQLEQSSAWQLLRRHEEQIKEACSYDRTVANLHALIQSQPSAEIVLAAVLSAEHAAGTAGQAVKALAQELGGLAVRFKPLLPLGRARQSEHPLKPDGQWTALKTREALVYGFRPSTTCGVGYSLYVGPEGETYPCYALMGEPYALGNVCRPKGLRAVLESDRYRALSGHTVDTNRQCRQCALRYLCGGGCRAWDNFPTTTLSRNLDDPPADCRALFRRARALLDSALETLEVPSERWLAAGLPLPELESILCRVPDPSARSLS